MPKYIFLRTAWMKHYQGVTDDDIPTGAGSYVTENEDGGEVCNFVPIRGNYYGYARIQGGRSLRIERLGASADDEYIDGVNIILFAKNPSTGGQYIVGWYKNARLYRNMQRLQQNLRMDHYIYLSKAAIANSFLVPLDDRVFETPIDGPGQTNAWYVDEYYDKKYLQEVERYVSNPETYISRNPKRKRYSDGWQQDAERRKQVEVAAMDIVAAYYSNRGFDVEYRHQENLGWDLEATLRDQTLLLEVKGLSGDFKCVDFTPNEYMNTRVNRKHYRICVVSNALDKTNRSLDIFYWDGAKWTSNDSKTLKVEEIKSARFHLNR